MRHRFYCDEAEERSICSLHRLRSFGGVKRIRDSEILPRGRRRPTTPAKPPPFVYFEYFALETSPPAPSENHPRSDRFVGALVDEDEGAGLAVLVIGIVKERGGGPEGDAADFIEGEAGGFLDLPEGIDIDLVGDVLHDGLGLPGGVPDDEFGPGIEIGIGKPADHGLDILALVRRIVGLDEHVAPRDVDLVFEGDRDRLRGVGLGQGLLVLMDFLDGGGKARGQHGDGIAGLEHAPGDAAGEAPEVVEFFALGTDDPLDRKTGLDVVVISPDVNVFQMIEETGALEPRHVRRFIDDIIPVQSGNGDGGDIDDIVEPGGEGFILGDDPVINVLVVVDEVHLVDRHNDVLDPEKVGDEGVTLGLLDHPFSGVDENDGQIGGRGAGDHVAGVLQVAGGVRDDELTLGRGEITVSDIDGDPLLALGLETIGEEGEVDVFIALLAGRFLDGFELIFEDRLGVIEKATDESGLAVIDGAGGGESEEVHFFLGEIALM